jgi:hypothetical protein
MGPPGPVTGFPLSSYLQFVINYISPDIRLTPRSELNLRYSGLLRSVGKWLDTDVSGAIDPICRGQESLLNFEEGTDRLSRNVGTILPLLTA